MIKLRNPWGYGEWKGTFSDYDTNTLTPELKSTLGYDAILDGVFFMLWSDFFKN